MSFKLKYYVYFYKSITPDKYNICPFSLLS